MRVLIVSPRFPPSNAADCHRVRVLVPYLQLEGWNAEVLAVEALDTANPLDPWLEERVPHTLPVHRVHAWPLRGWGLNGLAQRAAVPLYRAGCRLLSCGRFDLVFFSTTEFLLHALGPLWQRRFGVPFSMDYQDPWVNDYYRLKPEVVPPGGRFKYAVIDRLHRLAEKGVAPRCSGFLSVSEGYLDDLDRRYGPAVRLAPRLVDPFPAEPAEFQALRRVGAASSLQRAAPRLIRYIGRGGPDMAASARAFFRAWRTLFDEGRIAADSLRFEAIGTSYAIGERATCTVESVAAELGLENVVSESPHRLGYREALEALLAADALVVFGSDDPRYTASKIYPYLLAGRPMLALFREESSVVSLMSEVGGGRCIPFSGTGFSANATARIEAFLAGLANGTEVSQPLDMERFAQWCAPRQSARVARWFEAVVAYSHTNRTGVNAVGAPQ